MQLNDLSLNIINNERLYVKYTGKINISNSNEIKTAIKEKLENIKELVFDFSDVSYIASAGLRMLIDVQKTLQEQNGILYIKNPNEEVINVIQISGFETFLNII